MSRLQGQVNMTAHSEITGTPVAHPVRFGDLVEAVQHMSWHGQRTLSDHCAFTGQTRAEAMADLWETFHAARGQA